MIEITQLIITISDDFTNIYMILGWLRVNTHYCYFIYTSIV